MEERRKPVLGRVVPGVSPTLQRRLRRFYAFVQAASPSLAARLALRMFLTPPRRKLDPDDAPIVAQAVRTLVPVGDDAFTKWTWGEGAPVVVVLHGWGSHAARFGNFIVAVGAVALGLIERRDPSRPRWLAWLAWLAAAGGFVGVFFFEDPSRLVFAAVALLSAWEVATALLALRRPAAASSTR